MKASVQATPKSTGSERRRSKRESRGLRVRWRMLGARDYHFCPAVVADLSTGGLSLFLDENCRPGTVLMVEPQGVPAALAEPRLMTVTSSVLQLNGRWRVGGAFSLPIREKELQALLAAAPLAPVATTTSPVDRTAGTCAGSVAKSRSERRGKGRSSGLAEPVFLARAGGISVIEGTIVDRSANGLGLLVPLPFPRSTILKMRRQGASDDSAIHIQVRHLRQKGKQWFLGCQVMQAPPREFREWER